MKTFTININPVKALLAKPKVYTISDQSQITYLYPMIENDLGLEPTIISSISANVLINGNLEIDPFSNSRLIFTPNTVLDSVNINYTIEDSLNRTSESSITIITI